MNSTLGVGIAPFRSEHCRNQSASPLDCDTGTSTGKRQERLSISFQNPLEITGDQSNSMEIVCYHSSADAMFETDEDLVAQI